MNDFDELEDILISLKNNSNDSSIDNSPLEPPVKSRMQRAAEEKAEQERLAREAAERARLEQERLERENAERERLAREKAKRDAAEKQRQNEPQSFGLRTEDAPDLELPKPAVKDIEEEPELVWFENVQPADGKEQENPIKSEKKKIRADKKAERKKAKSDKKSSKAKPDFNKLKSALKKILTKQLAIILGIILLIAALAFGGVRLYEYSRVAYLKPYEKQYGIEYPLGILEEYCDQYGKNQHTVGELIIEDTNTNKFAANQITNNYVYAFEGTDVYTEQQFRSVDVTGCADLESIYSTTEGFLNSSQRITFNTLFEKADYKVIAAYYTNKNPEDDSGYVFPYSIYGNLNEKSFNHFADSIEHRRLYDTGFIMTSDYSYLSVSADSDFMENFKFVVVCVKTDSKDFTKSTVAVTNEKIHYPQVWYDINGETNPYRFSGKWYPEIYTDIESAKTVKLTADDFEQR